MAQRIMEPVTQPQPVQPLEGQTIAVPTPRPNYFIRLFRGRLNRQNYSVGSLLLIIVPAICYLIFVWELVTSPGAQAILANNPYDPTVLQSAGFSGPNEEAAFFQLLQSPLSMVLSVIAGIYTLVTLPIFLSLQVRRLHDLNRSGWLLIIYLIPLLNYIFPIYVTFFKGTQGDNTYGPPPIKRTNIKEDILCLGQQTNLTTKIVNYNTLQPDLPRQEESAHPL